MGLSTEDYLMETCKKQECLYRMKGRLAQSPTQIPTQAANTGSQSVSGNSTKPSNGNGFKRFRPGVSALLSQ